MDSRYTYFRGEKDKGFAIASMQKYVQERPELDKFLIDLASPYLAEKKMRVIDLGCGIGHLFHTLAEISPQSVFLGVDQTAYLIGEAKKLFSNNPNISFETLDAYDAPKRYSKNFDVAFSWKTISWLPHYEQMLKTMFAVAKKHIFISSLFYDGDIDFEIRVREWQKEAGKDGFNAYYNVYGFPRFRKCALDLGAGSVEGFDFEIGKDIPRGPLDVMGTYTLPLANGKRLQLSGAVAMLWKIIRIDL